MGKASEQSKLSNKILDSAFEPSKQQQKRHHPPENRRQHQVKHSKKSPRGSPWTLVGMNGNNKILEEMNSPNTPSFFYSFWFKYTILLIVVVLSISNSAWGDKLIAFGTGESYDIDTWISKIILKRKSATQGNRDIALNLCQSSLIDIKNGKWSIAAKTMGESFYYYPSSYNTAWLAISEGMMFLRESNLSQEELNKAWLSVQEKLQLALHLHKEAGPRLSPQAMHLIEQIIKKQKTDPNPLLELLEFLPESYCGQ